MQNLDQEVPEAASGREALEEFLESFFRNVPQHIIHTWQFPYGNCKQQRYWI